MKNRQNIVHMLSGWLFHSLQAGSAFLDVFQLQIITFLETENAARQFGIVSI
jgi:hypothetical protein